MELPIMDKLDPAMEMEMAAIKSQNDGGFLIVGGERVNLRWEL